MLKDYLPLKPRQWSGPVVLAAITSLGLLAGSGLDFDRSLIEGGELWRLFTANFSHLNPEHLLLNLGGIAVLWLLHGDDYDVRDYLLLALFCSITVTGLIYLMSPEVDHYAGLSGVLHGIFAWGVANDFRARRMTAWFLGAGLVIKLVVEQEFGGSPTTESMIGAPVLTEAHLYGAAAGSIAAAAAMNLRKQVTGKDDKVL